MRLAELALKVLPVVARDAIALLRLHLAACPLAQTLHMNVLHGAHALASCNERVPTLEVLLVLQADTAHLSRLKNVLAIL